MRLVFSTIDFKIKGSAYSDFPIILDGLMNIHWYALEFLINACIVLGTATSILTWEQYGRALYDFFSFCEANDHDWRDTSLTSRHSLIETYRNWCISECSSEASTVNDRLRIVYRLYEFALEEGWISNLPWKGKKVFLKDHKPGVTSKDTTGGNSKYPSSRKGNKTSISVLSRLQVDMLSESITNIELKLITRLGLACGLRKEELVTFPKKYIIDPKTYPKTKMNYRVKLDPRDMKTKGSKTRQIDIPAPLMGDLWNYIKFDRQVRASLCANEKENKTLFLTEKGRAFANRGRGLNTLYSRLDLPFKVNPHILRHTYATHTLYVLRKMSLPMEPLIYVRDRLGHTSIKTTELYLHFIELVDDNVLDMVQNNIASYYGEVANEAAQKL